MLARLLEDPDLGLRLRELSAPALRSVLLEIGLEDAGELIALTSFEQLRDVFDEDLWRSRAPGADADFDAPRFAVWLEVLQEAGDAFVADRLAEFSEDFLAFALSQLVRVIDVERATASVADADEADLLDKVVDGFGSQEFDGYLVIARAEAGWDAVWASVLALDARHPELLRALLRRLWRATEAEAEDAGGLYALLSESEQLQEDAAGERDDRRAARGFVSPADARAFLALARKAPAAPEEDAITRAYFRELAPPPAPAGGGGGAPGSALARLERLAAQAGEAGAAWGEDARALEATHANAPRLRRALAALAQRDAGAHQRAVEELAYLANVLVAGDASLGRAWRPVEAALRVLELCEAGLRTATRAGGDTASDLEALARWGAVGLFRLAWAERRQGGAAASPGC